jgi:sulfite exporter TauE/SafE
MPVEEGPGVDLLTAAAALGALAAGASGSLHCALMCGPLACAGGSASPVAWHVGRVASYAALGAALGLFGLTVLHAALPGLNPVLPWVMAAGLVATALDLGKHLRPLPGVRHVSAWVVKRSATLAPAARAGAIGAVTPFLPCGLVYGMAISALASGSAVRGLAVMGAFALGSVPALVLAQLQLQALRKRPRAFELARRVVPLAAALVLVWRALESAPGDTTCR